MISKEQKRIISKRNMKIFPIYKMIGWDFLFFYTIDFLFLTQIKNISVADVILKNTFYALFGIILQIPANIIVEFLGRKNSLIFGNILNCIYVLILMLSRNLYDLIFAELFAATAYAIKNIVETTLLNESIPNSKYKSKIFSRINAKGAAGYYFLNTITKIIAGFLFEINGYLPLIFTTITSVLTVVISMFFIEPITKRKVKNFGENEIKEFYKGFKFVLTSERLKALIISYSLISSILYILSTYNISILEDIGISSITIGIISAISTLLSAYASKKELTFHKKYRNKTITIISLITSISCIISGLSGLIIPQLKLVTIILVMSILSYGFTNGMYYTIRDKYLGNFANKKINTKIYAVSQVFNNVAKVIGGFIATFLIDKTSTSKSMMIVGIIFTILFLICKKYMKTRVGLKPEQYSREERKYDEFKEEKINEGLK